MKNKPKGILHIYGQDDWHDDVYIVGNKESLEALRDACTEALENKKSMMTSYVADGEGFVISVIMQEGEWENKTWGKIMLPYMVDYAIDMRDDAIKPWEIK